MSCWAVTSAESAQGAGWCRSCFTKAGDLCTAVSQCLLGVYSAHSALRCESKGAKSSKELVQTALGCLLRAFPLLVLYGCLLSSLEIAFSVSEHISPPSPIFFFFFLMEIFPFMFVSVTRACIYPAGQRLPGPHGAPDGRGHPSRGHAPEGHQHALPGQSDQLHHEDP